MIEYTTYHRIHELSVRDKLLVPQIAAELSLDERTVRFWLDQESYRPRFGVKRESKLDGFKKDIARWLEQYPLSATQVLRRLRENGYAGGYSILKEYIRQIRPARVQPHLTLRRSRGQAVNSKQVG